MIIYTLAPKTQVSDVWNNISCELLWSCIFVVLSNTPGMFYSVVNWHRAFLI